MKDCIQILLHLHVQAHVINKPWASESLNTSSLLYKQCKQMLRGHKRERFWGEEVGGWVSEVLLAD